MIARPQINGQVEMAATQAGESQDGWAAPPAEGWKPTQANGCLVQTADIGLLPNVDSRICDLWEDLYSPLPYVGDFCALFDSAVSGVTWWRPAPGDGLHVFARGSMVLQQKTRVIEAMMQGAAKANAVICLKDLRVPPNERPPEPSHAVVRLWSRKSEWRTKWLALVQWPEKRGVLLRFDTREEPSYAVVARVGWMLYLEDRKYTMIMHTVVYNEPQR